MLATVYACQLEVISNCYQKEEEGVAGSTSKACHASGPVLPTTSLQLARDESTEMD